MSTILSDLQANMEQGHKVQIKPVSTYAKQRNKTMSDIKEVFQIEIYHPDCSAGIYFSKYAGHYQKIITKVLDKHSNGKLYEVCCTECGNNLQFDIVWNKNRKLSKV